ncbi:MAG: hypothetical protein UDB11_03405 [Peptococcaceae bacterium]|nr:hypothetical protein [Peptococcaceae bacterium]
MQLQMKRMLVVMDGEGRELKAVIVEGERLRLIDRYGRWHQGILKKVHQGDIILEEDGKQRFFLFGSIDHIERMKRSETD